MVAALVGALVDRDERGQGLAEYALVAALMALAAIAVTVLLGDSVELVRRALLGLAPA